MITLEQYLMGREKKYPVSDELRANAIETVRRVNSLLERAGMDRLCLSGYRPPAINAVTPNAKPGSKHMTCQAIDLADANGKLDAWCMANLHELEAVGLWLEHPSATESPDRFGHGWCHVQAVAPKSGRRVFYP